MSFSVLYWDLCWQFCLAWEEIWYFLLLHHLQHIVHIVEPFYSFVYSNEDVKFAFRVYQLEYVYYGLYLVFRDATATRCACSINIPLET